jgi:hypothetical protein
MKMLSYAPEPVLIGDATADGLLAYAAMLSSQRRTKTVELRVLNLIGEPATAGILLTPSTQLMTLSYPCRYSEPDNDAQVNLMVSEISGGAAEAPTHRRWGDDSNFDQTEFGWVESYLSHDA